MADKIIAEYIVKTDKAIKNLDKLEKEVKDLSKQGKKAAKDIDSNFNKTSSSLVSQFKKVGAALGVAFAATEIIAFGKEAVKLASQAEGIERAFKRVGSGELLDDLRKATRGTVTDLELMKKAVQASNFKVPLDQLAKLFKFAAARARETGESVDFLVNSIVLGIGRKSPLILDNLGISAVELRTRLKGVGVEAANVADIAAIVGDIATEELEKMGVQADTTADKIEQLSASFENLKVEVGGALIELGFFTLKMNEAAAVTSLGSEQLEDYAIRAVGAAKALSELQMATGELPSVLTRYRVLLFGLSDAQKELIKESKEMNEIREEEYVSVERLNKLFASIDKEEKEQIRNVFLLKKLIKELTDEQGKQATSVDRVKKITALLIPLQAELAKLLGKETTEQKKLRKELEANARLREQIFTGVEMAEGIPVVIALSSTLNGLNQLLKEQTDILNNAPEFSKEYKEASIEIDKLKEKINSFNDDFIDPSLGNDASTLDFLNPNLQQESFDQSIEMWNDYGNQVSSIIGSISQIQANAYAYEQQELSKQLEQGLITREEYDRKRAELSRKQAASAKDAQLFQATISTAQAIVAALGSVPFTPANLALSALVGAAGAAQIAAIASAPLPQFAEGGWVDQKGKIHGRSHAKGGVRIEAEGDEFMIRGSIAKKNSSFLEAFNAGNGDDWINKNMVYPAIQNVLDSGDSTQFNNIDVKFKDQNLIASQDRMRQSTVYGLKMVANRIDKLSKRNTRAGW